MYAMTLWNYLAECMLRYNNKCTYCELCEIAYYITTSLSSHIVFTGLNIQMLELVNYQLIHLSFLIININPNSLVYCCAKYHCCMQHVYAD